MQELKFFLTLFCCFHTLVCHGGRVMDTVPLQIEASVDFSKTSTGEPNATSGEVPPSQFGGRVGTKIVVEIHLVNSSPITQTGTLELRSNTDGLNAFGYSGYSPTVLYFDTTLVLCGNVASHHNSGGLTNVHFNLPTASRWSIPPFNQLIVSGEAWISGIYGTSYASGGARRINVALYPSFIIKVDQDVGSVVASMTPQIVGLGMSGSPTTCSGKSYGTHYGGFLRTYSPSLPVLVNGGRGF